MNKSALLSAVLAFVFLFVGCSSDAPSYDSGDNSIQSNPVSGEYTEVLDFTTDTSGMSFKFSGSDLDSSYDAESAVIITLSDDGITSSSSENVSISGNAVTVSGDGCYLIRGTLSDGCIIVSAQNDAKPHIILDGVNITCGSGSAFYVENADKVFITLAELSENSLCDSAVYSNTEISCDAAIYSECDLTFNGSGAIKVIGNYKHGIATKDDLIITGGEFDITAVKSGIVGKDSVKISDGSFIISSGTDGIKSDKDDDTNKGFIYVSGGEFNVNCGHDGVDANTYLRIDGGKFNIKSGDGSGENMSFGRAPWNSSPEKSDESMKGIKCGGDVLISGGEFNLDTKDDSIHSNSNLSISGGKFSIKSGDDGIHCDLHLTIDGGEIDILQSYEGIEGSIININGGSISVISSDDGLNSTSDDVDSDDPMSKGDPNCKIVINGGYIFVDALGDGLDSNGVIEVSGGTTLVCGSTDSGNSAIDFQSDGVITGGDFIAVGSSGMAEAFGRDSTQCVALFNIAQQDASVRISLVDESGEVVLSFLPVRGYSSVIFSSGDITLGDSYTVMVGGEVTNCDSHGFVKGGSLSGGKSLGDVVINNVSSKFSGAGAQGGGRPGGRR